MSILTATDNGGDDYRAWVFTFASALACVLGGKHKDWLVHYLACAFVSSSYRCSLYLIAFSSFLFVCASQVPPPPLICMNVFLRLLINSRWHSLRIVYSIHAYSHLRYLSPILDLQIAGLIFIDTIVKTILGRDVRILQNHKFLAGSLGLGSGVMVNKSSFSRFFHTYHHGAAWRTRTPRSGGWSWTWTKLLCDRSCEEAKVCWQTEWQETWPMWIQDKHQPTSKSKRGGLVYSPSPRVPEDSLFFVFGPVIAIAVVH